MITELVKSGQPLHEAAARGDTVALERCLCEGADPDAQDSGGFTALHCAARQRHAEAAACLLAYGARHDVADRHGHRPLAPPVTNLELLHAIRQRYHRFRKSAAKIQSSSTCQGVAASLARDGFLKLPGFLSKEALGRLHADFRCFVETLQQKLVRGEGTYRHYDEEEHYWPADRAFVCNNAFKYSAELVRVSCDPCLLSLVRHYLGKPPLIQRGVAMRYLPAPVREHDMFGWHHDMEEQRLKIMILLTDIGPNDQCMSYVLGSHALFHPLPMFLRNTCSLDYCKNRLGAVEIAHTIGQAGDAFLFDSNGAHRGNRRPDAAIRDVFFIEFTADASDIWGGDIPTEARSEFSNVADSPFGPMLTAQKKWQKPARRSVPTWIENLPHVERWAETRTSLAA